MGVSKTLKRIQLYYHWPRLRTDVKKFIKSCKACALTKSRTGTPPGLSKPLQIPESPFSEVMLDLIGPLSISNPGQYTHIAVCVEMLTRFIILGPLRGATAENLARFLIHNLYFVHGAPSKLIMDNASINRSDLLSQLAKGLGTQLAFIAPYNHQSNLVEVYNKQVQAVLSALVSDNPTGWHQLLPAAAFAINTSENFSTGFSPFYLTYGRTPQTPLEAPFDVVTLPDDYIRRLQSCRETVKFRLLESQEKTRTIFNKSHKPVTYKAGDLVMISYPQLAQDGVSRKLAPKYKGPYKITKQLSDLNYEVTPIDKEGKSQIVNIRRFKPFEERPADLIYSSDIQADFNIDPIVNENSEAIPDPDFPATVAPRQENTAEPNYRTRFKKPVYQQFKP